METRFILLGLAADPADYAAEMPETCEPEPLVLTYRESKPDYAGWIVAFLIEGGLELFGEILLEFLFLG
jgi:hypothetical protein